MKTELRNYYKNIRKHLSSTEIEQKSRAVFEIITNHSDFKTARRLMIYVSFEREVETIALIKTALKEQKEVVIPISNLETCTITPSLLTSFEDLAPNKLGILELPQHKQIITDPSLIDLCLIPGLAFDLEGHRLGFGKGFYDRFLPLLKPSALKIGLAYECQISADSLPYEKHDFIMDKICTEKKLYSTL